ncbi:MAG: hypothetical protein WD048_00510 [Chitinophagales bacterium]
MAVVNLELKNEIKQRELAEKKLLEKANDLQNSNNLLKQLTYSASHDLKEPLRNITLMTQHFQKKFTEQIEKEERTT